MSYLEKKRQECLEPLIHQSLPQDGLSTTAIVGYSIGHVYNDLCAGVWFNFLLFYVTRVIELPPQISGFVMLSGQIADGLMTPLVGLCSDKTTSACAGPSFFGLFWECTLCDSSVLPFYSAQAIYYITLPILFNIGWASVQISNMSLIAQISLSKRRRDILVSYRTAATYASNFLVLLISLFIFLLSDNSETGFKILNVCVSSIGFLCSLIYIILVPEVPLSKRACQCHYLERDSQTLSTAAHNHSEEVTWKEWLSQSEVYIYGGVYMFSRLAINVFSSLTPFYLQSVLMFQGDTPESVFSFQLALAPMIVYSFSSISSLTLVERLIERFNSRLYPYLIGNLLLTFGMLPLFFLNSSISWPIYISAALIGVSFSLFLNISIDCLNDVVGEHQETGAFVFGFFSFLDKFSNGITLFLISTYGLFSSEAIRFETTMICLASSYLGVLLLYIGQRNSKQKQNESDPAY